jgi:hypothetical protein
MAKQISGPATVVAYHKTKRIFLSLAEIQDEDPDQIEIYEFKGENFNLVAS